MQMVPKSFVPKPFFSVFLTVSRPMVGMISCSMMRLVSRRRVQRV